MQPLQAGGSQPAPVAGQDGLPVLVSVHGTVSGPGVQVGEVQAWLYAFHLLRHGEDIVERTEHGGLAHHFRSEADRVAGLAQLLHAALQPRDGRLEDFLCRAKEVRTGVEDDVGGAGQVAEVRRVHQALAALGPFLGGGVQVDVVRSVDAEQDVRGPGRLPDRGAGRFA